MEKGELFCTVDGNADWCSHCGKQCIAVHLKKLKMDRLLTQWSHFWECIQRNQKHSFEIFYLFIFREGRREGEREGNVHVWEKHWLVAPCRPPTRDLACNPGTCPDQESSWWAFCLCNNAQPSLGVSQPPGLSKFALPNDKRVHLYQILVRQCHE